MVNKGRDQAFNQVKLLKWKQNFLHKVLKYGI